ncbi:MAG: class I SAM-dependent methyltransferase, partial [Acidobacteriota bacterium]|nr:class I SAM-dependent methyltransferase [Acidobacteriota bacterium]
MEIGCGTGLISRVLIDALGPKLARYACSDISPEMLARCQRRLGSISKVSFLLKDAEQLAGDGAAYDLVVTCSTVHHMVDLAAFFRAIRRLVRPGGFYLMLHEPSSRYPRNPECAAAWQAYSTEQQRRRWLRYLNPKNYLRRLRWLLRGQWGGIRGRVAERLLETGIVRTPISPE